jgi:hypothetical protein
MSTSNETPPFFFLAGDALQLRLEGSVVQTEGGGSVELEDTVQHVAYYRAGLEEPVSYRIAEVFLQHSDVSLPAQWWSLEPLPHQSESERTLRLTFHGGEFTRAFRPRLKEIMASECIVAVDQDYALYDAITGARTIELLVFAESSTPDQRVSATLRIELDYGKVASLQC